jgi:hypothetical protein
LSTLAPSTGTAVVLGDDAVGEDLRRTLTTRWRACHGWCDAGADAVCADPAKLLKELDDPPLGRVG